MTAAAIIERLQARGLFGVVAVVCQQHYVLPEEACGTHRTPHIVRARHRIWAVLHDEMGFAYAGIGRMWDVDHTTVMHALRSVKGQPTKTPKVLREAVLNRDGLVCGICGLAVAPSDVEIDHVVPLSKGGETTMENLRVTHSACNQDKAKGERPVSNGRATPEQLANRPGRNGGLYVGQPLANPDKPVNNLVQPSRALASRALSDQDLDLSQSSSLSGTSLLLLGSTEPVSPARECSHDGEDSKTETVVHRDVKPGKARESRAAEDRPRESLSPAELKILAAIEIDHDLKRICKRPCVLAADLASLGPGIDVAYHVRAAGAWLRANPERMKHNGNRFLTRWIREEQQKGPAQARPVNGYRNEMPGKYRGRDGGSEEVHVTQYRTLRDEPDAAGGPPSGDALKRMEELKQAMQRIGGGGAR